jgi:hypothetical protein
MDKVIGFGRLGCAIADELIVYPEYRVYKIGTDLDERGSLSIPAQDDMEAYEKNIDAEECSIYLRSIRPGDEVLVVVEGGHPINGALLRILETIKDASINILYVAPERPMISEIQKRDDRITFGILQEFARSGLFETVLLLDRSTAEGLMEDASIQDYEKQLANFISYVVAMINYFNHSPSVLSSKVDIPSTCRIATYGISSLDNDRSLKFLYPLEAIDGIHFYYGIPSTQLEEDKTLIRKIKDHVKDFQESASSVSYSVHATSYNDLMILCVLFSSSVQTLEDASKSL